MNQDKITGGEKKLKKQKNKKTPGSGKAKSEDDSLCAIYFLTPCLQLFILHLQLELAASYPDLLAQTLPTIQGVSRKPINVSLLSSIHS